MAERAPHDRIGATDPGPDLDRPQSAIAGAGAAFHATIAVRQAGFAPVHFKNAMGTNVRA